MVETKQKGTWGGARPNSGGERPGAGRPKKVGSTNKMRSLRLTDEEYDFVRWAVKQYRAGMDSISIKNFKEENDI